MSESKAYSKAQTAYTSGNKNKTGRELEAAVLYKAAQNIELLINKQESGEKIKVQDYGIALENNQKIWTVFVDNMMDENNDIPQDIKNNIASLAMFVFKRTKDVFSNKDLKLAQVLVDINRNIATGLSKKIPDPATTESAKKSPLAEKEKPSDEDREQLSTDI